MNGRDFLNSLDILLQLDFGGIIFLFWFFFLFEFPRYILAFLVFAGAAAFRRLPAQMWAPEECLDRPVLSVILPGHNEAAAVARCVDSIREQTMARHSGALEIIVVDDGSTDGMHAVLRELHNAGKIDRVLSLRLRSGKHAAMNLALNFARGDFILIGDIDCSYDRVAFSRALSLFEDPEVGAVGGDLAVRNTDVSLTTRFQAIEYLISISLGRQIGDALGILSVISGAFGIFRRKALESVGGYDAEVGEDADLTLKLRRAGWKIRFAAGALALTDVPDSPVALFNQRIRWDRGLVTVWGRKHGDLLNPLRKGFVLRDALATLDPLIFDAGLTVLFVGYLVWLLDTMGSYAWIILAATALVYLGLATVSLCFAALATGRPQAFLLLPYAPYYALWNCFFMRFIRMIAVLNELIFRGSYNDPYVPKRVMDQVERF